MKNLKTILLFLIYTVSFIKAQDPITSQPMSVFTETNPSFMGKDSANTAYINHRNQWPKIQGTYLTTRFGYQHYLSKTNGYLGFSWMNDDAASGTLISRNLSLNYTQNIKIRKVLLKVGAKAGYSQNVLDWDKIIFGSQIDQQLGFVSQSGYAYAGQQATGFLDFSIGISFFWKGFTIGGSFFHLTEPGNAFVSLNGGPGSSLYGRNSIHVSKVITFDLVGKDCNISPFYMFYDQGDFDSHLLGVISNYRLLILGTSYRNMDAFIFTGGLNIKGIKLLYSYDLTVSKLAADTGGSHEISLQFHPFKKRKKAHKNLMSVKSPFML